MWCRPWDVLYAKKSSERVETTTDHPQPCLFNLSFTMFGSFNFWDRLQPPRRFTRELVWGLIIGVTLSISSTSLALLVQDWRRKRAIARIPPRPIEIRSEEIVDGVIGLIGAWYQDCLFLTAGNTPLIRINSLSDALGVEILVRLGLIDSTDRRAKQRFAFSLPIVSLMLVSEPGRICERSSSTQKCV